MKKILSILTCAVLITGVMSSNVFAASIARSGTGYIKAQGFTESYMNVDTLGYTLYVEKYVNGYWITIKTFSYSLNNTDQATANHIAAVESYCYYRARSTNYIINNGVTTSKLSITNEIYVN